MTTASQRKTTSPSGLSARSPLRAPSRARRRARGVAPRLDENAHAGRVVEDRDIEPDRLPGQHLDHEARGARTAARGAADLVMVGLIAQHAAETVLRDRQSHELQGRERARRADRLDIGGVLVHRAAGAERLGQSAKVVARPALLAVCRVCLSEPEQADVPPKALWVATTTSTSRRFSSTAARSPAAPLPSTSASHRWTGSEKPRDAHDLFRRPSPSRAAASRRRSGRRGSSWGIDRALKVWFLKFGIDEAVEER